MVTTVNVPPSALVGASESASSRFATAVIAWAKNAAAAGGIDTGVNVPQVTISDTVSVLLEINVSAVAISNPTITAVRAVAAAVMCTQTIKCDVSTAVEPDAADAVAYSQSSSYGRRLERRRTQTTATRVVTAIRERMATAAESTSLVTAAAVDAQVTASPHLPPGSVSLLGERTSALSAHVLVLTTLGSTKGATGSDVSALDVAAALNDFSFLGDSPELTSAVPNLAGALGTTNPNLVVVSPSPPPPPPPPHPPSAPLSAPPPPSTPPSPSSLLPAAPLPVRDTASELGVSGGDSGGGTDGVLVAAIAVPLGFIALSLLCLTCMLGYCCVVQPPEKRPAFLRPQTSPREVYAPADVSMLRADITSPATMRARAAAAQAPSSANTGAEAGAVSPRPTQLPTKQFMPATPSQVPSATTHDVRVFALAYQPLELAPLPTP